MSEAVAPSTQERVRQARLRQIDALMQLKQAKLREIEAHRAAIKVHASTAEYFENCGLEAQAAVVRERAEHARLMLETAIREAEAFRVS